MNIIIYALTEPQQTWNIRYIGQTYQRDNETVEQSIKRRLMFHMCDANRKVKTHKRHWLRKLRQSGLRPEVCVLDIGTVETGDALEMFYIKSHRQAGYRLTNYTDGGCGNRGKLHSAAMKERFTGKLNPFYGRKHSAETIARISNTKKGWQASDEYRAKMSLAKKGVPLPKNKRTHCRKGHEYAGDNILIDSEGYQACRTCRKETWTKANAKKRQLKLLQ